MSAISWMLYLFTVKGHFQIQGKGSVMVRGASIAPGSPVLSTGTKIRLRPPVGREIDTFIKRFEITRSVRQPDELVAHVWLPDKLAKEQVPLGTQVFLLDVSYRIIPPPGIRGDSNPSGGPELNRFNEAGAS